MRALFVYVFQSLGLLNHYVLLKGIEQALQCKNVDRYLNR